VRTLISEGRLGIRNILKFNHALLGKWLWRYGLERETWWRAVVDSKYESSWGGWCSSELVGAYWVSLWKNIRKGWGKFCHHTRFEVGDGSNVKFWHDLWYVDMALKDAFPVLFGIARVKDTPDETHMEISEGVI
jgi:hypothetical protein